MKSLTEVRTLANPITGFDTKDGIARYDYNALANRPEDGTGTIISGNADYAEVGEWEDGNPDAEDRLGYFVAIAAVEDNTIKIRKATSEDDVKGVTVFNPAFSGNAAAEKYISDGVLYPQYSYVGLMGIVSVIDNGTCTVGGRCMPANDGTAVPSSNNMGYGVLERIDASHVLIAVEPGADMIQRIKTDIKDIENKINSGELDGADGFSPTISVSPITGGHRITITDKNGTKYVDVEDGEDYVLTDADIVEIADIVKAEAPLVKVAEQPTFVDSIEEMTDASKAYVMPDGFLYAYTKAKAQILTADDFVAAEVQSNGSLSYASGGGGSRIATKELLPLTDNKISISCPSPYQYFVYYFTGETEDTFIGKTSWKSGNIDDVSTDVVGSGTSSGAKYCRISLRDSTNTSENLKNRIAEFMENITVTQVSATGNAWGNTGLAYNQPADYEDRIIALEKALEGIEYGTY
jgi:hypothetical protein